MVILGFQKRETYVSPFLEKGDIRNSERDANANAIAAFLKKIIIQSILTLFTNQFIYLYWDLQCITKKVTANLVFSDMARRQLFDYITCELKFEILRLDWVGK